MSILDFLKVKRNKKVAPPWPIPYGEDYMLEELHLRDPYIITKGDTYYLTGTISHENISDGYGVPLYKSKDLKTWEGPVLIVDREDGLS